MSCPISAYYCNVLLSKPPWLLVMKIGRAINWEGNLVSAHHKLAMTGKKIMAGEDVSLERQLHYDWEFHFALVRACNSRHMIAVFQNIYEKYIGYQLVLRNYRWAKALEEQQLIF